MSYVLGKTVVLVGMMGAGKTAIGTALAKRIGAPFLDSDQEIERAANMTIAEIFARDGEPFFRIKEAQIISRLLETRRCILSTGGGAYLAEETRTRITSAGVAVWLNADLELLWQRVRHKDTRPLLRTADPKGTLTGIFEKRAPYYAKADIIVDAKASYAIEDMVEQVVQALLLRPDVLKERSA